MIGAILVDHVPHHLLATVMARGEVDVDIGHRLTRVTELIEREECRLTGTRCLRLLAGQAEQSRDIALMVVLGARSATAGAMAQPTPERLDQ